MENKSVQSGIVHLYLKCVQCIRIVERSQTEEMRVSFNLKEEKATMGEKAPFEKPTREQLEAAEGNKVPDIIKEGLRVLFCGINPGLYSGAVGHHFARPGNRFWKALHESGITPRRLEPWEEEDLLICGCGITNLVNRATARADDLDDEELLKSRRRLASKVGIYRPKTVAILGIGAYRTAFKRKKAEVGKQPEGIGDSDIWVLPNPSGLNANYLLPDLVKLFKELRKDALGH
jgi:TDG/mug DNA glycosylase family protein